MKIIVQKKENCKNIISREKYCDISMHRWIVPPLVGTHSKIAPADASRQPFDCAGQITVLLAVVSPNVLVMWHRTPPVAAQYVGAGSSRGFEKRQKVGANTGSHSSSTALTPVTHTPRLAHAAPETRGADHGNQGLVTCLSCIGHDDVH